MLPKEYYGMQRSTMSDTEMEIFQSFAETLSGSDCNNLTSSNSNNSSVDQEEDFNYFFDNDGTCSINSSRDQLSAMIADDIFTLNYSSANNFFEFPGAQSSLSQSVNDIGVILSNYSRGSMKERTANNLQSNEQQVSSESTTKSQMNAHKPRIDFSLLETMKKVQLIATKGGKGNNLDQLLDTGTYKKPKHEESALDTQGIASKDRRR